ncbi:hypothetical protein ABFS83_12G061700 [Erythranthe nasuta]
MDARTIARVTRFEQSRHVRRDLWGVFHPFARVIIGRLSTMRRKRQRKNKQKKIRRIRVAEEYIIQRMNDGEVYFEAAMRVMDTDEWNIFERFFIRLSKNRRMHLYTWTRVDFQRLIDEPYEPPQ